MELQIEVFHIFKLLFLLETPCMPLLARKNDFVKDLPKATEPGGVLPSSIATKLCSDNSLIEANHWASHGG